VDQDGCQLVKNSCALGNFTSEIFAVDRVTDRGSKTLPGSIVSRKKVTSGTCSSLLVCAARS
jgi:hypothetical protein